MNIVGIAFLFLLAGPLLRRFGLRLGIPANPLVLTVFALAMVAVNAISGGTSFALLAMASAARIADIALTDGMTRTSINATYQVLPERGRLSVQAAVEGMGVPIAIGISGVLILVLNALPFALTATIFVMAIVCAVWTVGRDPSVPRVRAGARRCASDGGRSSSRSPTWTRPPRTRRSRDCSSRARTRARRSSASTCSGSCPRPRLPPSWAGSPTDARPDVRLSALAGLAASGDETARRRLADEVRAASGSTDPAIRPRAASALEALEPADRAAAAALLEDDDVAVRSAALDSVQAGDVFAVEATIAALADVRDGRTPPRARSAGSATRSIPSMADLLDRAGSPAPRLADPPRSGGGHQVDGPRRGAHAARRPPRSRARALRHGTSRGARSRPPTPSQWRSTMSCSRTCATLSGS